MSEDIQLNNPMFEAVKEPEIKDKTVMVAHLITGEDVIGIWSTKNNSIEIIKPMLLMVQPANNQISVNLAPYPLFTASNSNRSKAPTLCVSKHSIVWTMKPPTDMENMYRKINGMLMIAENTID